MGSESGTRVQVAGYARFDPTNADANASAHMCMRRVGGSAALSVGTPIRLVSPWRYQDEEACILEFTWDPLRQMFDLAKMDLSIDHGTKTRLSPSFYPNRLGWCPKGARNLAPPG